MNGGVRYDFEWDPAKAKQNLRKHGVSFERAATVLLDPNALSIFDARHGSGEDRWITLGMDRQGVMLVVSHTFREAGQQTASIRIITSRKATRAERKQYEKLP